MKKLNDVITILETFASPELALFDYVGLLQGDLNHPIRKVGLTLDYSHQAIEAALSAQCDLLITHHGPTSLQYPLYGNNLTKVNLAAAHNLAVYRCHLSLDFCPGGIIEELCNMLEIPARPVQTFYKGTPIYSGVRVADDFPVTTEELLQRFKILRINLVRIAGRERHHFKKLAITSGKGFIDEFFDQIRPDVYIAGEFEQEATKYAEDLGITLIELSHHASEARPLERVSETLSKLFSLPVEYIEIPDTIRSVQIVNKKTDRPV